MLLRALPRDVAHTSHSVVIRDQTTLTLPQITEGWHPSTHLIGSSIGIRWKDTRPQGFYQIPIPLQMHAPYLILESEDDHLLCMAYFI